MSCSQGELSSDMKSEHTLPTLQASMQWKNIPSSAFSSVNQNIPAHHDLARLNAAAPSGDGCIDPPCTALVARQGCRSRDSLPFPSRTSETRLQAGQGDSFCPRVLREAELFPVLPAKLDDSLSSWPMTQSCSRNPLRRVNTPPDVPEQQTGGRRALATNGK